MHIKPLCPSEEKAGVLVELQLGPPSYLKVSVYTRPKSKECSGECCDYNMKTPGVYNSCF